MNWQSPKTKLTLAFLLLAGLLVLAPSQGISAAGAARIVLGLAALAGLAFWVQRRGKAAPRFQLPGRLTVAARTGLSPRCSVALVEADGRTYLVAYGDGFAEIKESAPPAKASRVQARKTKPLTRRSAPARVSSKKAGAR